jgi:hypothetical protein
MANSEVQMQVSSAAGLVDDVVEAVVGRLLAAGRGPSAYGVTFVAMPRRIAAVQKLLQHHPLLLLHGSAGCGKTTLLRFVFQREAEDQRYDLKAWMQLKEGASDADICVQQGVILGRVALPSKHVPLDNHAKLQEALEDKVVLLVIDNAWGDQLQKLLPADLKLNEGSCVLLSSRENEAANGISCTISDATASKLSAAVHAECLPKLTEEEGRQLFCNHCTAIPAEKHANEILEIAQHCCCIPMAIVVMAKVVQDEPALLENLPEAFRLAGGQQQGDRSSKDGLAMNVALAITFNRLTPNEQWALRCIDQRLYGSPTKHQADSTGLRVKDIKACFDNKGDKAVEKLLARELLCTNLLNNELVDVPESVHVYCETLHASTERTRDLASWYHAGQVSKLPAHELAGPPQLRFLALHCKAPQQRRATRGARQPAGLVPHVPAGWLLWGALVAPLRKVRVQIRVRRSAVPCQQQHGAEPPDLKGAAVGLGWYMRRAVPKWRDGHRTLAVGGTELCPIQQQQQQQEEEQPCGELRVLQMGSLLSSSVHLEVSDHALCLW